MSNRLDVALVIPPVDLAHSTEDPSMERLGVGYLAAALDQAGFSVQVWHCPAQSLDAIQAAEQIVENNPHLVGISVLFSHTDIPGMLALVQALRQQGCRAHVTVGGHAATFLDTELLEGVPEIDSVVRGEGEDTLVDLARRVVEGCDWRTTVGISWLHRGKAVQNAPRPLIKELDRLPFPTRRDAHWSGMVASSRGCPYQCVFCSVHPFYRQSPGKAWRARSAVNVVDEIEALMKNWGLKTITFVDDNFMGPGRKGRQRAFELGRELIRRKVYVSFLIDSRADAVDEEVLAFLMQAGLKTIFLGIESGSQRALDFLNKQTNVEKNRQALETIRRLGLEALIGFINFDPFTSLDDLKDNIRFYRETGLVDSPQALGRFFTQLKAYHGTPLEHILSRKGMLLASSNGVDRDLRYRFLDPRVAALADVAYQVLNQAGRSYVLSRVFREHQSVLVESIPISAGLLDRWEVHSLRRAFQVFAEMVDALATETTASLPGSWPVACGADIELPHDRLALAKELREEMQRALAAIDEQVLGRPFQELVQQIKQAHAARPLAVDYRQGSSRTDQPIAGEEDKDPEGQ